MAIILNPATVPGWNPWERVVSATFYYNSDLIDKVPLELKDLSMPNPMYKNLCVNGKLVVSNFIRFENLEKDFYRYCNILKIPVKGNFPHKNRTRQRHYTEYYDDESYKYVAKKFRQDIKEFNYTFG